METNKKQKEFTKKWRMERDESMILFYGLWNGNFGIGLCQFSVSFKWNSHVHFYELSDSRVCEK